MIRDVLLLQKREMGAKLSEKYVERDAGAKMSAGIINVIIGPRRAGKSCFALHTLRKTGNFGYVNFDDEKLVEVENYDEIIDAINSIYGSPKFLLFDEIQNLSRWELFVNRLQRQGYNLVITGSNSNLLSRELATHLTGRFLPI
ncbi:MAG: AAA family ATPase, partial [Candidatus Micrarchaeota archaeon]